jgi:hypothetical protein
LLDTVKEPAVIPSAYPRLVIALFWVSALMISGLSLRAFVLPLDIVMPNMAHFLQDAPLALWAHLTGGPLALALAPFQVSPRLRQSRPRLHRWMGRLYGLSILIAGLGALALLPQFTGSAFAAAGFGMLGGLWLVATALGIWHARARRFDLHRIWMVRSVALTCAAISLRIIMAPLLALGWQVNETYDITAWGSWIVTLIFAEWHLKRTKKPAPGPVF